MEVGGSEAVFNGPNHPYTEALLSAVPNVDGEERRQDPARGRDPEPGQPADRAASSTRAATARSAGICEVTEPPLVEVAPGHLMSCHIPLEELGRLQAKAKPGDVLYSTMPQVMTDGEELDAAASANAGAADAYDDVPKPGLVAPVAAHEAAEQTSEAAAEADAATPRPRRDRTPRHRRDLA